MFSRHFNQSIEALKDLKNLKIILIKSERFNQRIYIPPNLKKLKIISKDFNQSIIISTNLEKLESIYIKSDHVTIENKEKLFLPIRKKTRSEQESKKPRLSEQLKDYYETFQTVPQTSRTDQTTRKRKL